ncbi:membrane protein [Dyella japonica A8]|uniref:Membrane protein n=2 Tax=Dyella japonica TaxID=231455 RepID=A0A075JVD0_9GAMM|nr:membrane protein [Dyella japonica A8]
MALFAGVLFGVGLGLAGMTQPAVVLGFLDVGGAWDPRLLFVMAGAVSTTAIGYRLVWRARRPRYETSFDVPSMQHIDTRLLIGAAVFGIGWGIAGYCPGPALASLAGGVGSVWLLVAMMALGWWLASRWPMRFNQKSSTRGDGRATT